ncbi:hypothetical protein ACTJKC_24720 [Pedobacter sp. 22226]|uniref:hypothetical protein n=1 Tax=Pedobacter sp. 22226 TaxID=3453894 RepID=UPI003F844D88
MKITLDTKSLLLGFLGAGLMFTAISFKNEQSPFIGKYRTEVNANNMVVILNSEPEITSLRHLYNKVEKRPG